MDQARIREFGSLDSCTRTNCVGCYYQPQFKDGETKAQNGLVIPRSQSEYVEEQSFLAPETLYCLSSWC